MEEIRDSIWPLSANFEDRKEFSGMAKKTLSNNNLPVCNHATLKKCQVLDPIVLEHKKIAGQKKSLIFCCYLFFCFASW